MAPKRTAQETTKRSLFIKTTPRNAAEDRMKFEYRISEFETITLGVTKY